METASEIRWRRRRRNAMVYLYSVFLLTGVLRGLLWYSSDANVFLRVELLSAIATSLGFMWYCTADARLVGKPLLPIARVGIFILWPAGVPVYLLWARRLKGLGILLLHGVLLVLVLAVSMVAAGYLTYGEKFLD
jgi:hypothetical protein